MKNNLSSYAQPTEFEFRENIPVTAIGKVAYRDCPNIEIGKIITRTQNMIRIKWNENADVSRMYEYLWWMLYLQ